MTIHTNTPEYLNDLQDVARLFYPQGADLEIRHDHTLDGDQFVEWIGLGEAEPKILHAAPAVLGSLAEKRAVKRAAKIAIYQILREHTGEHPPWGSLTGIRPTRILYEALAEGLSPEDAARQVLIGQFDVRPERARLLLAIHDMQRGLIERGNAYDLYIGIPFCTTRCAYCSFSSGMIGKGTMVEPYIEALLREMDGSAALMKDLGLRVRAAYMGGGTPTSLTASQLDRVLREARARFPGAVEWTVEAGRPDTIDPEKLAVLKDHGIQRISVNPQSFSDDTLRRIGRAHTADDTRAAYALAREAGFGHINMDLICALPGEGLADFQATLNETIRLNPESVTVHTLAVKHGSELNERNYRQADAGEAIAMVDLAREALTGAGYRPYYLYRQKYMAGNLENVGYAKPGHACLYNIDIMEETSPILALGAGAITKWLFEAERRIERAPNVKNIEHYIKRVDEMIQRKRILILEGRKP